MHANRIEEANALTQIIALEIDKQCRYLLSKIDEKSNPKDLWTAVRKLTNKDKDTFFPDNITGGNLNEWSAEVSKDKQYKEPLLKQTVNERVMEL